MQVILLSYKTGYPMQMTSTIILGAFGLVVLVWSIIELSFLDKWLRYTFAFYPTVFWCILGVAVSQFRLWSSIFIACLVINAFCCVILIIRVPLVVWRSFNDPLYIEQTLPHKIDPRCFRQPSIITVL